MEWQENGTVLNARPHGEGAAVVELFTRDHGRHAGLVRGGASRRMAPLLQPGARVQATWRARLEEHLGSFTLDPITSRMPAVLADRTALAGLSSVTALLSFALPERHAYPRLHDGTELVLDMLDDPDHWPLAYLRWELALLEETGFGLDLSACAVTGATDSLIYVSPRTGRAVSTAGAGQWADRLLPLSPCLRGAAPERPQDLADALRTTGHFLQQHLAPAIGDKPLPPARDRLVARLAALPLSCS